MSLHLVLVDRDFKFQPEPTLAKVVAHNLTREQADVLVVQLAEGTVAGCSTGFMPYVADYDEPHAQTDPGNRMQCEEAVLDHSRRTLSLLQKELAKRLSNPNHPKL